MGVSASRMRRSGYERVSVEGAIDSSFNLVATHPRWSRMKERLGLQKNAQEEGHVARKSEELTYLNVSSNASRQKRQRIQ